jgi:hypothetical protein
MESMQMKSPLRGSTGQRSIRRHLSSSIPTAIWFG